MGLEQEAPSSTQEDIEKYPKIIEEVETEVVR